MVRERGSSFRLGPHRLPGPGGLTSPGRGQNAGMERKEFAPDAASVRAARAMVSESLLSTDDAAVAAVLASELSSNAVDHARTSFTVAVSHDALGALTVEVHDLSPELPVLLPLAPDSMRGRGLHLVDALACAWGVTRVHDDGKSVWFRLLPSEG